MPIVLITAYGDIPMPVRAMKAGAIDFLTEPFCSQDGRRRREQLAQYKISIQAIGLACYHHLKRHLDPEPDPPTSMLTRREREVLDLVSDGLSAAEIGDLMPRGILLALVTLTVTAFLIAAINPALSGVGAYKLGTSGEPILDGFRALYGNAGAIPLGLIALSGLIASFHAISLPRAPDLRALPVRLLSGGAVENARGAQDAPRRAPHRVRARPRHHDDAVARARRQGGRAGDRQRPSQHGGVRRHAPNILRAISFIVLRRRHPEMTRPFLSPFGQYGAAAVIAISAVTLFYQLQDPNFSKGVLWVIMWFAAASAYFALHGRYRLTLSPEEVLALQQAGPPWNRRNISHVRYWHKADYLTLGVMRVWRRQWGSASSITHCSHWGQSPRGRALA